MKRFLGGTANSLRYKVNPEAFAFLPRASKAPYDFTVSEAIGTTNAIWKIVQSSLNYSQFEFGKYDDSLVYQSCIDFYNRHGIVCSKENISLEHSVLETITRAYMTLQLGKDDTVLVATPTFGYYLKQLQIAGINCRTIACKKENDFLIDPIELEDEINRCKPKALLMCNPNNPTGSVMTQKAAEGIAEIVRKHDIFVISDEAFLGLQLNDDKKHFPFHIAAPERTLSITSLAKSIGLPVKVAFCVGPEDVINNMKELSLTGQSELAKKTLSVTLDDSEDNKSYFAGNRQKYLRNTQLVKEKIGQLNQEFCKYFGEEKTDDEAYVKPYINDPVATNLYLLDFSGLRGKSYNSKEINTGLDISEWLLQASVGVVPGECFLFKPEEMLVRIAIGCTEDKLIKAFDGIIATVPSINNTPLKSVYTSNNLVSQIFPNEIIR